MAAKHPSKLSPLARASTAACSTRTATAAWAGPAATARDSAGEDGMTDCTGNGATDQAKEPRKSLVLRGSVAPSRADTPAAINP
jgi:hypothetical protein